MSAMAAVDAPLPLEMLPKGVLQHALAFLDLYSLLNAAAVDQQFYKAAVAALRRISLVNIRPGAVSVLSDLAVYLGKHGQHLTSLKLVVHSNFSRCYRLTALPQLPSLQELTLEGFRMQLGPSQHDNKQGVLAAAAAARLTHLTIANCCLLEGPEGLAAVSVLTALQHLSLSHPCSSHTGTNGKDARGFPGFLLTVLVQLTHLSIEGLNVQDSSLQHLSSLTDLQELLLPDWVYCKFKPSALSALQPCSTSSSTPGTQKLTYLRLRGGINVYFRKVLTPLAAESLRRLDCKLVGGFDPALLAPFSQLQHLVYWGLGVLGNNNLTGGTVALLAQLAALQHLTHLELIVQFGPVADAAGILAALSAITSSSNLQYLNVSNSTRGFDELPFLEVLLRILPPGRRLPALQHLVLTDHQTSDSFVPFEEEEEDETASGTASTAATNAGMRGLLSHLSSCCPALKHLEIARAVVGEVDLTPLLQLQHPTALSVQAISNDAAEEVIARLPHLQRLRVGEHETPGCITAAGLQHLTALQHLTYLELTGGLVISSPVFSWLLNPRTSGRGGSEGFTAEHSVTDANLAIIAQLSSLQELVFRDHLDISDEGLLQLTALKHLTRLYVAGPDGLLGFGCRHVCLPTAEWHRGITFGCPVWPELLERLLRSNTQAARRLAKEAVLSNRQALLDVMGPQLTATLPNMRFQRTFDDLDNELADSDPLMRVYEVSSWTTEGDESDSEAESDHAVQVHDASGEASSSAAFAAAVPSDEAGQCTDAAPALAPAAPAPAGDQYPEAAVQALQLGEMQQLADVRGSIEQQRTIASAMLKRLHCVVRLLATSN